MEREIIERLAIDNALGELNDDTVALFEAYLAEHPETRTWVEPMTSTCQRTRAAIGPRTLAPRREEPPAIMRRRWPIGFDARALGRWAAMVLISLSVGAGLGRRSIPPASTTPPTIVQAEPYASPKGWDRVLAESEDGFWQTKALAVLQPRSSEVPRPGRTRAGFWNRYRQSKKERSYE